MQFDLTDDQKELRDTARRFLERETPISYARAMMDDPRGYREETWRKMADLGWMALPFEEAFGGLALGLVPLALLVAEMGRVVLPGPFFSTVVSAGAAISECGSDGQRKELVTRICSGELIATLAWGPAGRLDASPACEVGADGTVTGDAAFVPDAGSAETLVLAAQASDGPGLYLVQASDPGVAVSPVTLMDATRKYAAVRFESARAERLGDAGADKLQRVLDRVSVGLAAEMLGLAERVLEISVEYAKQRVQFDRPIGSFQAVKHRLANMAIEVESLRAAVSYAAWAIERNHPDAALMASAAKAYASDAASDVTKSGIQVHGGIGFTWEADLHLYFKRAKADEAALGDADWHRERVAQILSRRYA